jgi:membrane-bound serine protease (ClpP class)
MNPLVWSAILLGAGLLVIAVELFVPSAGLLGMLAGVLLLSSIIVAFFNSMLAGVVMIGVVAALLPFIFLLFVNIWPSTPIGRRVLIARKSREEYLPVGEHYDERQRLIGKRGTARTRMLPSGQVLIDGKKYDAVSQGMVIEPGDAIEVIAIRTWKIIVRRVTAEELQRGGPAVDPDDILSRPVDEFLT